MQELQKLQKELQKLEGSHHVGTIKNSCMIRDFLAEKYPQVCAVDVRYHDCVIYIERKGSPLYGGHEIYIRDDNWRDPNVLDVKLNWSSAEVSITETSYFDYLEVLGYIATEFKSKDSEFFKILELHMLDYARRKSLLEDLKSQIAEITKSISEQQYLQQKELFHSELMAGNYYVGRIKKKGKSAVSVRKINKVNAKTVDIGEVKFVNKSVVYDDLTLQYKSRRIKLDDIYPMLKDSYRCTIDEVKAIVLETLIYNNIAHHLYWNGMESLDDGLVRLAFLADLKIIPNNSITKDLDHFVNITLKELKELGKHNMKIN